MTEGHTSEKKPFFSDKYNIILIGILMLGLILRLYYINANQALWWDEADWLSIAKHWAFGVPFDVSNMRPPFFPFLAAIFYTLGANEFVMRLFMVAISVSGIYLTYLICKDFFDKKVALIASFTMSVFYLSLFFTARIMVDILMMVMWLLFIWLFWKGYVKKGSKYYLWLMGVVMAFGSAVKLPFVILAGPLALYVFINEGFAMFKNKQLWASVGFFFLALIPYIIYFNISYGGAPFLSSPAYGFGHGDLSFDAYASMIPSILASPIPVLYKVAPWFFNILFLAFLFGLGYILMNLFLGWDLLKKEHNLKIYLFLLALMVVPYVFFSFVEAHEDRYLFMIYPFFFMLAGLALVKCYTFLKKYNKFVSIAFITLVMLDVSYYQVSAGDALIKNKAASYVQLKYAGLWIKERTNPGDIILNSGVPQNTYYSERKTMFYPEKEEDFDKFIEEYKPKYMVLSALEKSPEWTYSWPDNHRDRVVGVQIYFADAAQQRAILGVYKFIDNSTV